MSRIDPVRVRIDNVPLPESGFRFGDIVLHDGASTGHRTYGERQVPVFNAMQRLRASWRRPSPCSCSDSADDIAASSRCRHRHGRGSDTSCAGCAAAAATARRTSMVDEAPDEDQWRRERDLGGHRAGLRWKSSWRCGLHAAPAGCWRPSNSASTDERPEPGQVWWLEDGRRRGRRPTVLIHEIWQRRAGRSLPPASESEDQRLTHYTISNTRLRR
jgi:hypothetical protein